MLNNAVEILRAAGTFTLQWFDNPALDVTTKSDGTPVTEADRGAEQIVRERLAALPLGVDRVDGLRPVEVVVVRPVR